MRRPLFLTIVLFLTAAMLPLLAGCPVFQRQDTPKSQEYRIEPMTRRGYFLYVPSTYRPNAPCPVIISCHGTIPYDMADMHIREWKYLGEKNNCIIIAPELEGTDGVLGSGPTGSMIEDERYILSILSELGTKYNIDRANIMITGFSGGGFPTYFVGFRHPDIFSVIVARNCNFSAGNLEGWYPPEAINRPVYVYYGSQDPGPIQGQSDNAIKHLRQMGFTVQTYVVPNTGHERHPEIAMAFFKKHMRPARPSRR